MQRVFGENGEFNHHVSEIEMPRIAEEAGKNWEKFFVGMGECYKPAWQKQIGFTEREKMDIALNVKTKTAFGGVMVKGANSAINVHTTAGNKSLNYFGNQVGSMSVFDVAKSVNSIGGTALKTAAPMAFWVGPAIESSLMIADTIGSKAYYGDNMSTGQLVTGLLASQITPAIGMIPGANGAGSVLSAVGKAQGGMLINYQMENLGKAIDFREENGKGSLQKGLRISSAERRLERADKYSEKHGKDLMSAEQREKLENRANNGGKKYNGTKFDKKSFVIQSGTAAASAGLSASYGKMDCKFASDMGAAVFNMAMGQGVNAGLNAGNQYVDAAWDVTEKNKGFDGNYQNSFKKVNKDLKKQKLADLAGVNIFSMLETIISAGIRDEMKSDDKEFYKSLGMSGAEARAQVSLDDSNEALREKKNKEIENVEKRNKNYDKKQAAQREKQRKQDEKAAQLVNANQGMTPDDVKGEQGEAKGMFGEAQDGDQPYRMPEYHRNEKGELVSDSGIVRSHVAALGWPADMESYMGTNVVDEGNTQLHEGDLANAPFESTWDGISYVQREKNDDGSMTFSTVENGEVKNTAVVNSKNLNFLTEANSFIDQQIKVNEEKMQEYDTKNLKKDDNYARREKTVAKLKEQRNTLNTLSRENMAKHGDSFFTLTNVIYNEAGNSNQDAKTAIAYAYLNRTGGDVREPLNAAEISNYKQHNIIFNSLSSDKKVNFLNNYVESMKASQVRLSDSENKKDPTSGATHWVSPSGLPTLKNPPKEIDEYYLRNYNNKKVYFPNWATLNRVRDYHKSSYKEFSINKVSSQEFLFYTGVNYKKY